VGGCRDPGGAVNVQADQAGRRLRCLAGVDAHPDADLLAGRPRVRNERPLHLDDRGHTGPRRGECREEAVTLGDNLLAVVPGQAGADQLMVGGEDLCVRFPQASQHRRRTLDVSKEEGERLRGQRPEAFIRVDIDRAEWEVTDLLERAAEVAYLGRRGTLDVGNGSRGQSPDHLAEVGMAS